MSSNLGDDYSLWSMDLRSAAGGGGRLLLSPGLEQGRGEGGTRLKFCQPGSGQERPQSHNMFQLVLFPSYRGGPEVSPGEPDAGPGWGRTVPFLSPRVTRICPCQPCPLRHTFD